MNGKQVIVTKGYIRSCDCCRDVRDSVREVENNYKDNYKEEHPDTTRRDYSIEDDVKGIVGYRISGSDGQSMNMCEECMDAMLRATKVLQANNCSSVTMDVTKENHEVFIEPFIEKSEDDE